MRSWRMWGLSLALVAAPAALHAQAPARPAKEALAGKPADKADKADKGDKPDKDEVARRAIRERLRNEVMDQMRAVRTWRLTEELKLDQKAAATVFPILAEFDERGREIGRERHEIKREVHEQTGSANPDNGKLKVLVERLQANQARRNALADEQFKALKPALTPLQQAKLLLLLPRIEGDFRQRIRQAMDAQRKLEDGQAAQAVPKRGKGQKRPPPGMPLLD